MLLPTRRNNPNYCEARKFSGPELLLTMCKRIGFPLPLFEPGVESEL